MQEGPRERKASELLFCVAVVVVVVVVVVGVMFTLGRQRCSLDDVNETMT